MDLSKTLSFLVLYNLIMSEIELVIQFNTLKQRYSGSHLSLDHVELDNVKFNTLSDEENGKIIVQLFYWLTFRMCRQPDIYFNNASVWFVCSTIHHDSEGEMHHDPIHRGSSWLECLVKACIYSMEHPSEDMDYADWDIVVERGLNKN